MSESLPASWATSAIGEICEPVSKRGPDAAKASFRYVDLSSIDRATKSIAYVTAINTGSAPSRAKQVLASGDILFSNVRVYLENIAQVPDELDGEIGSTAFCVLRPAENIDPRYLYHFVTSRKFVLDVDALQRGNSPPSVQDSDVRQQTLPIAPSGEQRRIVSKIDELFSRIDEGDQALHRVEKLVERYRQSVLKAAVTGELTRNWREARKRAGVPVESGSALLARILKARRTTWESAELAKMRAKGKPPTDDRWKQKYNEPATLDTTDLPALPEGWVWASIDQIGLVSGGLTKNQRRQTLTAQRPYLRVANVYANRLDLDDVQQIGVEDGELDRVLLQKDDLLVVEGNGSIDQIGRVAVWDGSIAGCVHQNHLIKVRCTELLPSWYALIWCLSPLGRDYIRRVASSTAGLHTLSISKVASLPVPVPTPGELDQIRDRFDQAVALVATERQSLRQSRTTSAALRQSILKAAFSGQLVPQDPHDEPASKLLERIAAERAAEPSVSQRKKKSA